VKPAPLAYRRPASVEEACALLAQGGYAKVVAGGQSLVPLLNFRLATPDLLVDLRDVPGLDAIRVGPDAVHVGAMATQRALERDAAALAACPLLALALPHVGHTTTRNRGTVGGTIAHADPAAELPCVLACLDGEVDVVGTAGPRPIPAQGLFVTHLTSSLADDEVLTEVRFPVLAGDWGFGFREVAQRHGDYAMAMAAVAVRRDGAAVAEARVAVGAVADRPLRLPDVEAAIARGAPADELRALTAGALDPSDAPHAPADYRRALAGTLVVRALGEALA
jgi:carbon-monoxide dehydrogenase medium subunit